MTEDLLALVPAWGPLLLLVGTFLSCLALPIPASLLMLAAGAFAGAGDLSLTLSALAALIGAVSGDQTGFLVGRFSARLLPRIERRPAAAELLGKARGFVETRGSAGVFFSRWLASPLGPYVNVIGGATGMNWTVFTLAGVAGEMVWVGLYVGAGWIFADRIDSLSGLAGNISGALTAGAVTSGLGWLLVRAVQRAKREIS